MFYEFQQFIFEKFNFYMNMTHYCHMTATLIFGNFVTMDFF